MRIEGKETVTTNDSGKDETISWQFKAVVVVAIVVLVTFTPVIIFVHGKTTNREARIESCGRRLLDVIFLMYCTK